MENNRITGFDYDSKIIEISLDKLYGLAYFNPPINGWYYHIGSFACIYGAYRAYYTVYEGRAVIDDQSEEDFVCFLFEFDDVLSNPNKKFLKPLLVINHASLSPQLNAELGDISSNTSQLVGSIRRDLSPLPEYISDSIPPVDFEDY